MAILSITQIPPTGQVSTPVAQYQMDTNDTLSAVTTAGYINNNRSVASINLISPGVMLASTTDKGVVLLNVEVGAGGVITLVNNQSSSDIVLPTIANRLAQFKDAAGTLGDASGTAAVAGNFQAGLSGTAGVVTSFPATASTGSLSLKAVSNSGNFTTTISNAPMAANTTISIPAPTENCSFMLNSGINTMGFQAGISFSKAFRVVVSGAVTLNEQAGGFTTGALTTAAGSTFTVTVTSDYLLVSSSLCNFFVFGGGTNTTPGITVTSSAPVGDTVVVTGYNAGSSALNGTVNIGFIFL